MKKRSLSLVLVMVMLLTAGCSGGKTEAKTAAVETEAAPAETVAAMELEATTAVTEAAPKLLLDVTEQICVPSLRTLGDATLADSGLLEEDAGFLFYTNADEEDLDLFISLCGYCGLYSYGGAQTDGTVKYYLLRPGSDYMGIVLLDPAAGELLFQTKMGFAEIQEEQMEGLSAYYLQDLALPAGYGPNVHPEFFASIGRTGADSTGLVNNVFGTEEPQCWREVYAGVDYPTLHKYLSDMMLCGFDIRYEEVRQNEEGVVDTAVFYLDNGSSALMIVYYADSGMANLFYQPGVDRYLLKNADYAMYMPQK